MAAASAPAVAMKPNVTSAEFGASCTHRACNEMPRTAPQMSWTPNHSAAIRAGCACSGVFERVDILGVGIRVKGELGRRIS